MLRPDFDHHQFDEKRGPKTVFESNRLSAVSRDAVHFVCDDRHGYLHSAGHARSPVQTTKKTRERKTMPLGTNTEDLALRKTLLSSD